MSKITAFSFEEFFIYWGFGFDEKTVFALQPTLASLREARVSANRRELKSLVSHPGLLGILLSVCKVSLWKMSKKV